MKNYRSQTCRIMMVIFFAFIGWTWAQEIDMMALNQETQRMSQAPDEMTMVWWLPEEFWEASFAQTPGITASDAEEFLKVVRPYTMVVVVDGTIGTFGGITYKSESIIRSNIHLWDSQNKSYAPLNSDAIDADTQTMLQIMKPVLANMLGPMGENMHFLLFPSTTITGKPIADAKTAGQFKISLGDKEFRWRLPLDALLAKKMCSQCNQECKGSWSYCPWCGSKLAVK